MNSRSLGIACVCVGAMLASTLAVVAHQELPEGTGRDVTQRLCSVECHGLEKVIAEHKSKSQWVDSLDQMKTEGAKGTEEEFKIMAKYLTMHFGVPVKINKATVKQIDDVLILDEGLADAIVKYRETNGPFADLAALLKVPGLDAKMLEEQKGNIVFQ